MRIGAVVFAVEEFHRIQDELRPLLEQLGMRALTITVRQRGKTEDMTWVCQEIGYESADEVFWAVYHEAVPGPDKQQTLKQFKVILDVESIDAITFETFVDPEDQQEPQEPEEDEESTRF